MNVLHTIKRLQQCLDTCRIGVVIHVDVHVEVAHDDIRPMIRASVRAELFQNGGQFVEERRRGNI